MFGENVFLTAIWRALRPEQHVPRIEWSGQGILRSCFAVTDLAAGSVAAAALAASELVAALGGKPAQVTVDRRSSSLWFGSSIRPLGWTLPPAWDPIAGDYRAADGWIRLHTNAPHHREVVLAVLHTAADRTAVARAVERWNKNDLEEAIVNAGGCAAAMHSADEWTAHAQGAAIVREPLAIVEQTAAKYERDLQLSRHRPLRGVRVLDLTRVLAGPVATRFLAGLGAHVLRIDPPWGDEPALAPEVTLGKHCARLNMRQADGLEKFITLLSGADILIHGYRPGALERLGFDAARREKIRPGLIDVSLDAYGWSGPWRNRRGFDSLVQMSSGIAHAGMKWAGADRPVPLPVQALDHATGYLLAAAALIGLSKRVRGEGGFRARASLARMASMLIAGPMQSDEPYIDGPTEADFAASVERTAWGLAQRLNPPAHIEGTPLTWDLPSGPLGAAAAQWH